MASPMVENRGCAGATTMRRACDVCSTRSALWYCAADEGYLCTACDTQVHAANAVSLRHERVRLAPSGTVPKKKPLLASQHEVPYSEDASTRKRPAGSSQPYSHHLRKLTRLSNQLVEDKLHRQAELELFDCLDAESSEFFLDQEVPSLGVTESSPTCSSDLECVDDRDGDRDGDSLAAFFKGKAAAMHSQTVTVIMNSDDVDDQFCLVPDAAFVPADTHVDLAAAADDAFFFPADIPGLESFVPEMDLVDDFSLSCFDLALRNHGLDAYEGDNHNGGADITGAAECKTKPTEMTTTTTTALHRDFLAGPFAKFFAQKSDSSSEELPMDPERIKREARAMLQCCGEDEVASVPSLQLNVKDVQAAWSEREEPWIVCCDDAGLVPDLDGDRDARVLRYKEKRRTRLFSRTIRYEVRKLNAERRPRMKGRFVKRTTTPITITATATVCS